MIKRMRPWLRPASRLRCDPLRLTCCLLVLGWLVPTAPQAALAQLASAAGVTSHMGPPVGARRYRPGVWGLVEVLAVNTTDQAAETESVLRFADDTTLQYGRRVLVPAHSTLRSTCPILVPADLPSDTRYVEFLTEQVEPPPSDRAKNRTEQDVQLSAQRLLLDHDTPAVGIIGDLRDVQPPPDEGPFYTGRAEALPVPDDAVYEMVIAAKRFRNLSRRISDFAAEDLPAAQGCLDVLDVLVLSTDRLASDPGGIAAVRDWVLGGGHLWILLSEVQSDTVSAIMGEAFGTQTVDRVQLTQLEMHNARTDQAYEMNEQLTFEQPVGFVRVIARDAVVTDTVDGWPAAFWQPFGAGQVFFTTLDPAAWLRPATWRDPPPRDPGEETPYFPREPLKCLALECFVQREPARLDIEALQPILTEQIGYRIISRWGVTAILALFCLVLLVSGLWFYRAGRTERLMWAIPLAAIGTSLVFLAIGIATKKSVPPTAATITQVVFQPGVNAAHASGLIALYNQDACDERVGGTRGGIFFPDMTSMTGRRRRMTWTDEGAWHWSDLELPAGVRTAPFDYRMPLDKIVDCRAQFGPQGLQGSLGPLPYASLQDAIIAHPYHRALALRMRDDGTFTAGQDDVLPPGIFLAETWLNDAQRRRQVIYERLLVAPPENYGVLTPPLLYAWTDATDMGFIFPQTQRLGSTLLSIPVRLEKTPPGTRVAIPAPFVPYQAVPGPDGKPPTAYANLMHHWVETRLGVTEQLRFQMPATVLPLSVDRATLSLTVRAASRSLTIFAFHQDDPVPVLTLSHPIGSYSVAVDRAELLQLDADGGLRLAISVSDDESATPSDQMSQASWHIASLQLEVNGTVLE